MSAQSIEQPVNIKSGDTQPDLMYEHCIKHMMYRRSFLIYGGYILDLFFIPVQSSRRDQIHQISAVGL